MTTGRRGGGRSMLDPKKVEEVRRLLVDESWSHRRIAVALGVGRSTVGRIARGDYAPGPAARNASSLAGETDHDEEELLSPPRGAAKRCPRCGAMVQQPCLACRVRLWEMVERISRGRAETPQQPVEKQDARATGGFPYIG